MKSSGIVSIMQALLFARDIQRVPFLILSKYLAIESAVRLFLV